jgi:hypothetical protein
LKFSAGFYHWGSPRSSLAQLRAAPSSAAGNRRGTEKLILAELRFYG